MKSYAQFVTTPTADTQGTSLVLHFDDKTYLFGNSCEGTQRAFTQQKLKLTKLSHIFLSGRTEWSNIGGLIGTILSVADVTSSAVKDRAVTKNENNQKGGSEKKAASLDLPSLTIHGGQNLFHTLAATRRFIFRKGMPIDVEEFSGPKKDADAESTWEPTWQDDNIRVYKMAIDPKGPSPTSAPVSSRKRSFDVANGIYAEEERSSEEDQQLRKDVVGHMFRSKWDANQLEEMFISQVHLPATLYIRDEATGQAVKYRGPLPQPGKLVNPDIKVLVRKPWPASLYGLLPPTQPSKTSLSYIVRNHPQRGKFLPEVAKALGVEKQHWKNLTAGKQVEASDGKVVTPDMVMEKGTEGNGFAVIDLPSRSYVQNLLSRPEWSAKEVMTNVGVFVWILGPGVARDPAIQNFIKETKHVKHIVASPEVCPNFIAFTSSAAASTRLSKLDPSRYTIPIYDNRESIPLWQALSIPPQSQTGHEYQTPTPRMEVGLQPKIEVKTDFQPVNTAEVLAEMDKEVLKLGEDARKSLLGPEKLEELHKLQEDIPSKDAEIIALGTGSAIPSNYRNVSGTLLRIPGRGSYLFDCGENTLGQMRRTFSEVQLREVLRDLRCIWISHLHADHHLGTISVIKAWHDEVHGGGESSKTQQVDGLDALRYDRRLFVISDKAMGQWLGEYSSVEDYGYEKIIPLHITNNTVYGGSKLSLVKAVPSAGPSMEQGIDHEAVFSAINCSDIQAVAIDHCNGAKAVSFTWPNGFKFSYSGDGRPCKHFMHIGQHSTVLLHEATFDDELHKEALQKKHSTTSEALAVGKGMRARRVLLTHFSQRYPKFPVFDGIDTKLAQLEADMASEENGENNNVNNKIDQADSATHHTATATSGPLTRFAHDPASDMKVGVMFDYMRVRVGEIAHLEAFTPALRRLCESIEEGEAKVERKLEVLAEERLGKGKGAKKGKAGQMGSAPGVAVKTPAAMAAGAE